MLFLSYDYVREFEKNHRLRPAAYDIDNHILPIINERPRFSQIVDLINRMNTIVPDNAFSEKYTHHYFIHSATLNDGLVAAIAICGLIYDKYSYPVGDYIVDRSKPQTDKPTVWNQSSILVPQVILSRDIVSEVGENNGIELTDEDEDNNANLFLYHASQPEDIFEFDQEGIEICFVIYADDKIREAVSKAETSPVSSGISFLPPEQAAAQLHYTYLNIFQDTPDDLACVILDQIQKNHFSAEKTTKQIKALSRHPAIKDEYTAVAAVKHIINEHINFFGDMGYLLPVDFRCYLSQKTTTKKKAAITSLIGLEKELETLNSAANMLIYDRHRERLGLSDKLSGCNMIFSGQPGTAKTTTAREFAKMLSAHSLIPGTENFRECRKSDIVGQYVGQTAKKVDELFSELNEKGGGVIFFDEIYTLSEANNTSYDTEAINCITQNMENYRSKIFCIFAGYENKMNEFISSNPGLSSRITTTIRFHSYDNNTLCKIFENIAATDKFTIEGTYNEILCNFFNRLRKIKGDAFGNGREARNLFENAKRITASEIDFSKRITKKQLSTITAENISIAADEILSSVISDNENQKIVIGF